MPLLHILPLGLIDAAVVQRLALALPRRFAETVVVDPPAATRAAWKAAPGARFSAPAILRDLIAAPPADGGWCLALLDGELVAPGLRSACGFATIGGCCAIVALTPLVAPTAAQGEADTTFQRLLVEAVHEVGHLAGLEHCPDEDCVMHFSESVQEVERKHSEFCASCRARAAERRAGR